MRRQFYKDLQTQTSVYKDRWGRYGYSPLSLGWTKGKQDIRFGVLLDRLECEGRSFLDVGCGFGDLNKVIRRKTNNYRYLGIDMVPEFIDTANKVYKAKNVRFRTASFLSDAISEQFDYVVASGIFGVRMSSVKNYEYITQVLSKMLDLCSEAVSVDFLSSNVNFRRRRNFHASPSKIVQIASSLSRCFALRHDYMPFEFALRLYKDDRFSEDTTVFLRRLPSAGKPISGLKK